MDERIRSVRQILGRDVVILGHHYQRDEVIRFADFRGDSYKLSKDAAQADGKHIVFCGVHFMAESADILGQPRPAGDPARSECRLLDGRHGRNYARSKTAGSTASAPG